MLFFLKDKGNCTGCTACMSNCPTNCIEMKQDDEGFWYPFASEKCINCGKCMRVCPQANLLQGKIHNAFQQKSYAALTNDKSIWARSTSGGAFSEICRAWGRNELDKSLFVGAAWDGLTVRHAIVEGFENISTICKSKYVSSYLGNCFLSIKNALEIGKRVVFCGTPCQVAGLKASLGNLSDCENLLTIDLVCHGVGSQKVFNSSMDAIGNQFGATVEKYEFRSKRGSYEMDYLSKATLKFPDESIRDVYLEKDQYSQLFLSQNCLRPSCGENCKYRSIRRQGDITLADFRGLFEVFPELKGVKQNYSAIVVNSFKGMSCISLMKETMSLIECDIEDIKKYNPLIYRQTYATDSRDTFFFDYGANPRNAIEKWTKNSTIAKRKFKKVLFDCLPVSFRKAVYRVRRCKLSNDEIK